MKKKGFTLTEMIAAIVIIALILGLAIAAYQGIRRGILRREYENLVTYLETKAANYSEETGELNVTVERLIETGYIEPDEANVLKDPRDNSSMNCFIFDSKYENGNYHAKMEPESIGEDSNGKCNSYEVSKEIQICVRKKINNEIKCVTELQEWYNDNVELGVLIGGQTRDSAVIVWKVNGTPYQQAVYKTDISSINKGIYTAEVRYDDENNGVVKHFEGTDTVAINIDREKPSITKAVVANADVWTNKDKEISVIFTDYSGSGVVRIVLYDVGDNHNMACPQYDPTKTDWVNVTGNNYVVAKGTGNYRVCVMDAANNISDPYPLFDENDPDSGVIVVEGIDNEPPTCEVSVLEGAPNGENGWYISYPTIILTYHDNGSGVIKYTLRDNDQEYYGVNNDRIEVDKDLTNQLYYGFVRDSSNNVGKCELEELIFVDTKAPLMTNITKSTESWTNEPIELKTNVEDNTSLLAAYAITGSEEIPAKWTPIDGNKGKEEIKYKANTNGVYYIWVKDTAGNYSNKSTSINNFDNTKPEIGTPTIVPSEWTNNDVTISVGAEDNESKIAAYAITKDSNIPTQWKTVKNSPSEYNISEKVIENGTYYIWVKDSAGNISYTTIKITNIDKVKPTVNTPTINPTKWTNENVTITAGAVDNDSKLKEYAITKTDKNPTSWIPINGTPKSYNITETVTENGTYYIWAKDNANNISKISITITNIDKVKPTIKTPVISPTKWTNGSVAITADANDNDSKLAGYAITTSDSTPVKWNDIKNAPASYKIEHQVTENGTYYIWVKDSAGNMSYTSIKVANIDKIAPTIKTPAISPTNWTNGNVTITASASDKESKLLSYAVTTTNVTPTTWVDIKNAPESYNISYTAKENGTYYIWVKDSAGNISSSSIKITNIDITKPTATTPILNPSKWTNGDVTISSTLKDSESKLKGYEITSTNKVPSSWREIKNSPASQNITYTASSNGTYYIWVKDVAENVSSVSIEVKIIDKAKPTISNLTTSPTAWTNGKVKITASLGDSESKLLSYAVINKSGTPTNWVTINNSPATFSLNYEVSDNGTYYVWVKDNAQNVNSSSIKVANIDKQKPTVSVQYTSTKYDACATSTPECYDKQNGCAYYNNVKCTYVGEVVKDTTYNDYYCNSMYGYDTYNPNLPTGYPSAQEIAAAQGSYYSSSGIPKVSSGSSSYLDALLNNADAWYEASHQNAGSYYNSPSIGNNCSIPNSVSVTCKCMETNYEKVCNTKCNPGYVTNWDKTGKFTITASDDVKLAYYAVTKSNSTPSNSEWKQIAGDKKLYTTPYSVNTNGTYYVWIKDAATNTSYTTVKVVTADSTAPTISGFTIVDADNNEYNSNNMKMTIAASDSDSGVYEYCVSKTNSASGCSWSKDNPTIMTDGTNGSGSKLTYYAFVRDKVGNVSTSKSASYTLYKACTKKISRKGDSVGECTGECGNGKQSVTHYWKDAYLGTTCDNTTGTESCIVIEGCCQGCQCYGNCPPIPNIPTIPTCDWKCMADYNSAAWHNCTGTCSYYNDQGILTEGGTRSDLHNANEGLYGNNCTGCTYTESNGQWHYPNGDCANCKS